VVDAVVDAQDEVVAFHLLPSRYVPDAPHRSPRVEAARLVPDPMQFRVVLLIEVGEEFLVLGMILNRVG
jgi:hypothetical protein